MSKQPGNTIEVVIFTFYMSKQPGNTIEVVIFTFYMSKQPGNTIEVVIFTFYIKDTTMPFFACTAKLYLKLDPILCYSTTKMYHYYRTVSKSHKERGVCLMGVQKLFLPTYWFLLFVNLFFSLFLEIYIRFVTHFMFNTNN